MTTIRIGASMVKNRQEIIDWLVNNIGPFVDKKDAIKGYDFIGTGWSARWRPYGSGWFMDVSFDDSKYASFFTLRWK